MTPAIDIVLRLLETQIRDFRGELTVEEMVKQSNECGDLIKGHPDFEKLVLIVRQLVKFNDVSKHKKFYRIRHKDGTYIRYDRTMKPVKIVGEENAFRFIEKEIAEQRRLELSQAENYDIIETTILGQKLYYLIYDPIDKYYVRRLSDNHILIDVSLERATRFLYKEEAEACWRIVRHPEKYVIIKE